MDRSSLKFNNIFPVIGGSAGAATQIQNIQQYFPTWETVTSSIIITIIGAVIGYMVKLVLDRCFRCKDNKKLL